jgi:hypothetical protein
MKKSIDYFDICPIYLGIITEKQCETIFKILTKAKKQHIIGTMTFGYSFWLSYHTILEPYMKEELIHLDHNDYIIYPMIIVFLARVLLKNEGVKE